MKYLCSEIWEVEWSGILFCSTKGEFGKKNFEITAEYVFPMNKGSQAYTEFETTGEYIDFMMAHPESMGWQRHLIHSHNNMSVFFSGTDMSEIKENSEFYNYYISLIVNNKNEMCGKVAFRGKTSEEIKRNVSYKGDNGEVKTFTTKTTLEKEVVYINNCEIIKDEEELVDEYYKNRVGEIIKQAQEIKSVKDYSKYTTFKNQPTFWEDDVVIKNNSSNDLDNFVCVLLSLDNLNVSSNVEAELAKIKKKLGINLNPSNEAEVKLYCKMICENYVKFYDDYFEDPLKEHLIDTLEEVCSILENHCASNWVADELYASLICFYEELIEKQDKYEPSFR